MAVDSGMFPPLSEKRNGDHIPYWNEKQHSDFQLFARPLSLWESPLSQILYVCNQWHSISKSLPPPDNPIFVKSMSLFAVT